MKWKLAIELSAAVLVSIGVTAVVVESREATKLLFTQLPAPDGLMRFSLVDRQPEVDVAPEAVMAANEGVVSLTKIENLEHWQRGVLGSGVYLGGGLVVTNKHVAQEFVGGEVGVVYGQAEPQTATANVICISKDWQYDFALIQLPDDIASQLPSAQIGDVVELGETLYVMGSAGGFHGSRRETNAISANQFNQPGNLISVTSKGVTTLYDGNQLVVTDKGSAGPGDSGGLIADAEGKLVAVLFGGDAINGYGVGLNVEKLRQWAYAVYDNQEANCE